MWIITIVTIRNVICSPISVSFFQIRRRAVDMTMHLARCRTVHTYTRVVVLVPGFFCGDGENISVPFPLQAESSKCHACERERESEKANKHLFRARQDCSDSLAGVDSILSNQHQLLLLSGHARTPATPP